MSWTPSRSSTSPPAVTSRHELLIRLRDGLRARLLGPAEFLPAAERTDLVLRMDRWVVERAVAALATPRARADGLLPRGQRLGPLAGGPGPRRLDPRTAQGGRGRAGAARAGDHRDRGDRQPRRRPLPRAPAQRARAAASPSTTSAPGYGSFSYLKNLPFTHGQDRGGVRAAGRRRPRRPRADHRRRRGGAGSWGCARWPSRSTGARWWRTLRALGVDDGQGYQLGRPRPLGTLID